MWDREQPLRPNMDFAEIFAPGSNSFRQEDWEILSQFWHPLAFSHEIRGDPVSEKLLDMNLVIYRTSHGITVARDLSLYKGTRISSGKMDNDYLICPFHGLRYAYQGYCMDRPAFSLITFESKEHCGIVWTRLKRNREYPLPNWAFLDSDQYIPVFIPSEIWKASASRHVENFNDVAHFPFVHASTFGGEEGDPFPIYQVRNEPFGLSFELPYTEVGNRFPDGRADLKDRQVVYRYQLTFPFSTCLEVDVQGSDFLHVILDTVCPRSARESKIFQILTDNSGELNAELWLDDAVAINSEDRPLVEAQTPEDVPLDLREEVHIPADRFSLEYRRAMSNKFGLGAPISS